MSNRTFEILGQNIRQERNNQNMTQEQLSEKVGISAVFLSQIENARKIPSLETIDKIVSCLGISMMSAFDGDYVSTPNIDKRIDILLQGKSENEKQFLFDTMNYIANSLNKNGMLSVIEAEAR